MLPLRANPPDMVINVMLPPAAYILMNQLYEQGVAPSAKTWLYDGAGIADYPDFWQNVKEAGKYMVSFGLYHPKMTMPTLGKEVGESTRSAPRTSPTASSSRRPIAAARSWTPSSRRRARNPKAIVKALQDIKFDGVRGPFTFGKESGYKYQQWVDIPYVNYQLTEVNQPVSASNLIQGPGQKLDVKKLQKAK